MYLTFFSNGVFMVYNLFSIFWKHRIYRHMKTDNSCNTTTWLQCSERSYVSYARVKKVTKNPTCSWGQSLGLTAVLQSAFAGCCRGTLWKSSSSQRAARCSRARSSRWATLDPRVNTDKSADILLVHPPKKTKQKQNVDTRDSQFGWCAH